MEHQKGPFIDKCRCCLKYGILRNMWVEHRKGEQEIYGDMLNNCFGLTLQKHEKQTKQICESCINRLRDAIDFKNMVLSSEHLLLEYEEGALTIDNGKQEMELFDLNDDEFIKIVIQKDDTDGDSDSNDELAEFKTENIQKPRRIQHEKFPYRYKHQDNLRSILLCTNATPIGRRTDKGFECGFCDQYSPNPADLKRHTLETHNDNIRSKYMEEKEMFFFLVRLDITKLTCNLCNENIDTLEKLLVHLKTVHDENVHTDLKNQIIPFKFESDSFHCFMCDEEFVYFKLLSQHMTVHYNNYQCETCDKWFINKVGVKTHSLRHKTGDFPCTYCPKIFDASCKSTHHQRVVHQLGNMGTSCGFCGQKFRDNNSKTTHLTKVHNVKSPIFKCSYCNKTVHSRRALKNHVESVHLKIKRFKCTECDMEFFDKTAVRRHMVKHTKSKDYVCNICGRGFGRKSSLNQHRLIHYEDHQYNCEHCGLTFAQRPGWRTHMLRNHKEYIIQ